MVAMENENAVDAEGIRARLRALRVTAGLSCRELSRLADLAPSHVALIEDGTIKLKRGLERDTLRGLCRVLACEPDYLVRGSEPAPVASEIALAVTRARQRRRKMDRATERAVKAREGQAT